LASDIREEYRVRECESGVLERIFGPNRDEMTGGFRKLHNEELHTLDSLTSIIRMVN
jgi:hypothetical protein